MGRVDAEGRVGAVYRSIHPRLWRSLLAYTGNPELASDAEAEAFAQVLRRGDAIEDVAAWVWRSAFRIAAGLLSARPGHDDVPSVQVRTGPADSVTEFMALLAELSAQQRACVALRYLGNYTAPEIGELLGTTAATVRVQLHRAHAALRNTIVEAEHA